MTRVFLFCALFLAGEGFAQEPPGLEKAMETELKRAMTQLRQEGYPPAYYASLTAIDVESWEERCVMGYSGFKAWYRQRLAVPDLRVGDYTLDNHPTLPPTGFVGHVLDTEDDEFALRHSLWRMFDGVYKNAAADFLRKEALRVSRGKTEYDTDDLSRETPRERLMSQPPPAWASEVLEDLCRKASSAFRGMPGLLEAQASVRSQRKWSRLRDSEGSRVDFGHDVADVALEAVAISTDGLRQYASRRFVAISREAIPSVEDVKAAARDMVSDLKALQIARTTSPFSAPALLDPSAAAAVVVSIADRLSGEEQRNPRGAQTFRGRMGKAVLPREFTLEDDPTLKSFNGAPLAGAYDFDDQGMPAQKATLIERGILKGLLLSRYPVKGFPHSNGHARNFPGYAPDGTPGNLILTSTKSLPINKLLELLRAECRKRGKPYGLWVKKMRSFSQNRGTSGQGSLRIMPGLLYLVDAITGELILVRDLDMVGTPLVLLDNFLRAGDDAQVQTPLEGAAISAVVPSLLLSDAEIQRSEGKPEKLPILPPPVAEGAKSVRPHVPFVPETGHIQVQRYVLRKFRGTIGPILVDCLRELRTQAEGENLRLDAKAVGRNLPSLGECLKSLDSEIERLAQGAEIEKSVLSGTMTSSAYRVRYGDGWPDGKP